MCIEIAKIYSFKLNIYFLDYIDFPMILTMEDNKRTYTQLRKTKLYEELWRLSFIKCYRMVDIKKLVEMCLKDMDENGY